MTPKWIAFIGVVYACLAVIVGAFGAHALKDRLSQEMHAIFEVGVRYQMYHALGLIGIALLLFQFPHAYLEWSALALVVGTFIFSGSLYILALSGVKLWGAVTPIGGLLLVIGWLIAGVGLWKS